MGSPRGQPFLGTRPVGLDNSATHNAAKASLESWYPDRDVLGNRDARLPGGGVHCQINDQPVLPAAEAIAPTRARFLSAMALGLLIAGA
jgi:hypothetical protein